MGDLRERPKMLERQSSVLKKMFAFSFHFHGFSENVSFYIEKALNVSMAFASLNILLKRSTKGHWQTVGS